MLSGVTRLGTSLSDVVPDLELSRVNLVVPAANSAGAVSQYQNRSCGWPVNRYAERKILVALPKMAEATNSAELKAAFEKHKTETEGQVDRLQQVFKVLKKPAKGKTRPRPDRRSR